MSDTKQNAAFHDKQARKAKWYRAMRHIRKRHNKP